MEIEKLFDQYAEKLLNNTVLKVKENQYRICEIEMYYYHTDHPDEYTHRDQIQLEQRRFYPHRFKNGTYKSGTYKCLDITFGNKERNIYFGILIRSIMNIKTGNFISGPCLCVNELLKQYSCSEFAEFLKNYQIDQEFILEEKRLSFQAIYIGPRVGLGNKYPNYREKKYRYAIHINKIKKQKIFEIRTTQQKEEKAEEKDEKKIEWKIVFSDDEDDKEEDEKVEKEENGRKDRKKI